MTNKTKETIIRGVKGFSRDWKCNDYQFKENGVFKHDAGIKLCERGFHLCENPLDVFGYYAPGESRYAEVEAHGETEKATDDSKVVCSELHVKAEIGLHSLIGMGVKFILDKVDWKNAKESNTGHRSAATNTGDRSAATNTGDRSAATNTGYQSAATNTGHRSAATNTGDRSAATNTGTQSAATNTGTQSAATVEGKESVAASLGIEGKSKGAKGCWLVLAEWADKADGWHRTDVQSVLVDGKKIKADTWYMLKEGKFVEVQ